MNYPEDWADHALQDLATLTRGKFSARPRNDPKFFGGEYPFVQTGDIRNARVELRDFSQTLNEAGLKVSRLFPKGTLLFTIAANIGDISFLGFDAACPDSLIAIDPKAGVSAQWLYYQLGFLKQEFEATATQNAQLNINLEKLNPFRIKLPPMAEQEAIAEALSDADALIEGLERLIAKKRLIKQGAMQDLLTAKRRLPGFSGEWGAKPLSWAISGLRAGVSVNSVPDTHTVDGRPAVLKTSAIFEGRLDLRERKPIADKDIARARSPLRAGTILISRMNTPALVGECGYVEEDEPDVFLPDRIWMTEFYRDRGVCSKWLAAVLSSNAMRSRLKEIATGTSGSMKNIAKGSLLSEVIHFPPPEEQEAIAESLHDMDAEIQALGARLEKARQVKEGMTQNLFAGRIRLV
jgi:type I restriction enzyme S subunit